MLTTGAEHAPTASTPIQQTSFREKPVIAAEKLKQLYALMLKLRLFAERRKNKTANLPALYCLEACQSGCVVDLRQEDCIVVLPDQDIGFVIEAGQSATASRFSLLANAGRDRIAIATGIAFANRWQTKDNVVVVFTTTAEIANAGGAIKFADAESLPIIYLILPPSSLGRAARNLRTVKHAPVIPVDQSDAVAIYRVAYEAIDKARRGAGPTLIECMRFKLSATKKPQEDPHCSDPIFYMESYLRKRNLWQDDFRSGIEQEFSPVLDRYLSSKRSHISSR